MRKFLYIFVLLVSVCLLAALFLNFANRSQEKGKRTFAVQEAQPEAANNPSAHTSPMPSASTQSAVLGSSPMKEANSERLAAMEQQMKERNVPIDFYGRVVDQDGKPLAGAKVHAVVRNWDIKATGGSIPIDRTTDAEGRFDIHGITGDGFDMENVTKEGYDLEPGRRSFGALGGTFTDPVILKMWSTNIHEQLITGNKSFQIKPDGRPYFIGLSEGSISESSGGDLKTWIQYTNQVVRGELYDWSCAIYVINGGLLETDSYAMFAAPTEGYVPSFEFQQKIKGGQHGSIGEKRFYLKLKNGQEYGRMTIGLYAPYGNLPGLIRIQYAVNPSGSRILR